MILRAFILTQSELEWVLKNSKSLLRSDIAAQDLDTIFLNQIVPFNFQPSPSGLEVACVVWTTPHRSHFVLYHRSGVDSEEVDKPLRWEGHAKFEVLFLKVETLKIRKFLGL